MGIASKEGQEVGTPRGGRKWGVRVQQRAEKREKRN